jgi:hypothetical protein
MTPRRTLSTWCAILMPALAALSVGVTAQKTDTSAATAAAAKLPARIWRAPGAMAALDLIHGAGGKARAPNPASEFTFAND